MKNILALVVVAVLAAVLFASCESDDRQELTRALLQGDNVYTGTFITTYHPVSDDGAKTTLTVTREFVLRLQDKEFTCGSDTEGLPSAYGQGEYRIENGKIVFQDMCFRNALYSWDWILSGEYKYSFDGGRLRLSKEYYGTSYKYDLERVKGWLN